METHGFANSSFDKTTFGTMMGAANPGFVVTSSGAWLPTAAGGTRSVSIAAGSGVACGILGTTTAAATVTFAANSGSTNRFDVLVARWNWSANDVVFTVLTGGATPTTINTTGSVNSAQVNRLGGQLYDGVVAIVRVRPGATTFNSSDVIDMRTWYDATGTLRVNGTADVMEYAGWLTGGPDTGWITTPGVGGEFSFGSGGSKYRLKNGYLEVRSHIAFSRTLTIGGSQGVFVLPTGVRPSYGLDGPWTYLYGGGDQGAILETILSTSGLVTINGRFASADGFQMFIPAYPVGA